MVELWKIFFYLLFSGGIFISLAGIYYKKAYISSGRSLFGNFKNKTAILINLTLLFLTVFPLRISLFGDTFDWVYFIYTILFWLIFGSWTLTKIKY